MTSAWTSQDTSSYLDNPANGNRYAYAADNPTNNTDPTGMCSSILGCLEYIAVSTVAAAGSGATIGFGIGCIVSIEAGCVAGGGIGSAIGFWSGAELGFSYSLAQVLIHNE